LESRGRYSVINQFGYLGKYQFGHSTLRGLGYSDKDIEIFIHNPSLQEEAMSKLIDHNLAILKNYDLFKYIGKSVHGIPVTAEGMLAGAHLLGPKSVKDFITKGVINLDGNGTTIVDYMNEFI
jgi:hypothetical protein